MVHKASSPGEHPVTGRTATSRYRIAAQNVTRVAAWRRLSRSSRSLVSGPVSSNLERQEPPPAVSPPQSAPDPARLSGSSEPISIGVGGQPAAAAVEAASEEETRRPLAADTRAPPVVRNLATASPSIASIRMPHLIAGLLLVVCFWLAHWAIAHVWSSATDEVHNWAARKLPSFVASWLSGPGAQSAAEEPRASFSASAPASPTTSATAAMGSPFGWCLLRWWQCHNPGGNHTSLPPPTATGGDGRPTVATTISSASATATSRRHHALTFAERASRLRDDAVELDRHLFAPATGLFSESRGAEANGGAGLLDGLLSSIGLTRATLEKWRSSCATARTVLAAELPALRGFESRYAAGRAREQLRAEALHREMRDRPAAGSGGGSSSGRLARWGHQWSQWFGRSEAPVGNAESVQAARGLCALLSDRPRSPAAGVTLERLCAGRGALPRPLVVVYTRLETARALTGAALRAWRAARDDLNSLKTAIQGADLSFGCTIAGHLREGAATAESQRKAATTVGGQEDSKRKTWRVSGGGGGSHDDDDVAVGGERGGRMEGARRQHPGQAPASTRDDLLVAAARADPACQEGERLRDMLRQHRERLGVAISRLWRMARRDMPGITEAMRDGLLAEAEEGRIEGGELARRIEGRLGGVLEEFIGILIALDG